MFVAIRSAGLAACLAVALAGCAGVAEKPSEVPPLPAVDVEYTPPEGWQVLAREHYEHAAEGMRMRLRLDEWPWVRMDLFAYQVGVSGDVAEGLEGAVQQFSAEMDYVVEQGAYQGWTLERRTTISVAGPELLANGTKLTMRVDKAGEQEGSLTYLYYRPPFALKVRASYPGHVDERTEAALDVAVSELIPALKVTAPRACDGRKIEVRLPPADPEMKAEDAVRYLLVPLARAQLRHALMGCADLVEALEVAAKACAEFDVLCDRPPWSIANSEGG